MLVKPDTYYIKDGLYTVVDGSFSTFVSCSLCLQVLKNTKTIAVKASVKIILTFGKPISA